MVKEVIDMWFLCQEPCETLEGARKRAMEVGRKNPCEYQNLECVVHLEKFEASMIAE